MLVLAVAGHVFVATVALVVKVLCRVVTILMRVQ